MRQQSEPIIFVDLETTGVESWRPIMQIAAIAVGDSLRELETFEAKIAFDRRLADPKSLRKNHYSMERWKAEAQPNRKVASDFAKFLKRYPSIDQTKGDGRVFQVAQLVAHKAEFDGPFLQMWFGRLGWFLPASPRMLCTLQRAIWLFHEDKSLTPPIDFKLGTLCQYFGVRLRPDEAHDALADVRATVGLYREIVIHEQRVRQVACG